MKLRFILALFGIFLACPALAGSVTVTIENAETAAGKIMISLVQGEAEFKGEASPIAALTRRAIAGPMGFVFKDLPEGEYALQIMHDVNDNGELDSNFIGMPTEPWAFSNNATGNMGPPGWQDVKFLINGDVEQSIRLNH